MEGVSLIVRRRRKHVVTRMKRKLTDEEGRLWANAMRAVRPLPPGRAPSEPPASAPAASEIKRRLAHAVLEPSRPATSPRPTPALVPLPRRDKQRLARGHLPIEARLDLHGMTQTEAHAALARFLGSAQANGAQFVLVITGTGARGVSSERGVLRRQVPLWLHLPEFRPYVVGFESAHAGHGGEGALYIRLRRLRPKVL
jgi:DNA-nicking Smr family endonuclease